MTHDELLAKIDEQITTWLSGEYGWPKQWLPDEVKPKTSTVAFFKALCAVVELAGKLQDQDPFHEDAGWNAGYNYAMYEVIQAIQEQLI